MLRTSVLFVLLCVLSLASIATQDALSQNDHPFICIDTNPEQVPLQQNTACQDLDYYALFNKHLHTINLRFHFLRAADDPGDIDYSVVHQRIQTLMQVINEKLETNHVMELCNVFNGVEDCPEVLLIPFRVALLGEEIEGDDYGPDFTDFEEPDNDGIYVHNEPELYLVVDAPNSELPPSFDQDYLFELHQRYGTEGAIDIFVSSYHPSEPMPSASGRGYSHFATIGMVGWENIEDSAWPWFSATHLIHEIGHVLSLGHAHNNAPCNSDQLCGEIISSDPESDIPEHCQCYNSPFQNNYMESNALSNALTPMQLQQMMKHVYTSQTVDYVDLSPTQPATGIVDFADGLVITGEHYWTAAEYRVLPGRTVVIDAASIILAPDTRITVHRAGRLEITNGSCLSSLIASDIDRNWNGITVLGNPHLDHPPIHLVEQGIYPNKKEQHGVLILEDGSRLQSAKVAISMGSDNNSLSQENENAGGILICRNTELESRFTVRFNPFHRDNVSYFRDVDMQGTNTSISIHSNHGVLLDQCRFEVLQTQDLSPVLAFKSSIRMDECNFYVNRLGATFIGDEGSLIRKCAFRSHSEWGPFHSQTAVLYANGLRLIDASFDTYRGQVPAGEYVSNLILGATDDCVIENNSFDKNSNSSLYPIYASRGMKVIQSGADPDWIYRNTFQKLDIGIDLQGKNTRMSLQCNSFDEMTEYDILVSSGDWMEEQGLCDLDDPDIPIDCSNPQTQEFCFYNATPLTNDFSHMPNVPSIWVEPSIQHPDIDYHYFGSEALPNTDSAPEVHPISCTISQGTQFCLESPDYLQAQMRNPIPSATPDYCEMLDHLAVSRSKLGTEALMQQVMTKALKHMPQNQESCLYHFVLEHGDLIVKTRYANARIEALSFDRLPELYKTLESSKEGKRVLQVLKKKEKFYASGAKQSQGLAEQDLEELHKTLQHKYDEASALTELLLFEHNARIPRFKPVQPKQNLLQTQMQSQTITSLEILLIPNPVRDQLTLHFERAEAQVLSIYDAKGQLLIQQPVQGQYTHNLNLSHWKPGVYFVNTLNENGSLSLAKFIKI